MRAARLLGGALAALFLMGADGGTADAPPAAPAPVARRGDSAADGFRLWWSFPRDDASAIEIDDSDFGASSFADRKSFVAIAEKCDARKLSKIIGPHDVGGPRLPVREVRIEHLDGGLRTLKERRCVLPLKVWRVRLGVDLVERLEDTLDAHLSFLLPRKFPKAHPQQSPNPDARPSRKASDESSQ